VFGQYLSDVSSLIGDTRTKVFVGREDCQVATTGQFFENVALGWCQIVSSESGQVCFDCVYTFIEVVKCPFCIIISNGGCQSEGMYKDGI
jgi:hypothetical protein